MKKAIATHNNFINCISSMVFTVALNPLKGLLSGHIMECNAPTVRFIGYTITEMKRMGFQFFETVIHPLDLENYAQAVTCLLSTKRKLFVALYRVKPKNSKTYVTLRGETRLLNPQPGGKEILFVNSMFFTTAPVDEQQPLPEDQQQHYNEANYRIVQTQLSQRNKEYAQHLVTGKTDSEIAELMFISLKTAQYHRGQLKEILQIYNLTLLILFLISAGITGVVGGGK